MSARRVSRAPRARLPGQFPAAAEAGKNGPVAVWDDLISSLTGGRSPLTYSKDHTIFRQGDPADSVFYLRNGEVKLSVTSEQGKEAIVAVLGSADFFGEGCLAGQIVRMATAKALTRCTVVRVEKALMARMLHAQHDMSELFIMHLLSRNIRYEEDLVDHLFNSSEKRLARILLLLAHYGKEGRKDVVVPRISQESLAEMVGTTRSRVNQFMNKFRKLGFIDYEGGGGLSVNSGLLTVVLHD